MVYHCPLTCILDHLADGTEFLKRNSVARYCVVTCSRKEEDVPVAVPHPSGVLAV